MLHVEMAALTQRGAPGLPVPENGTFTAAPAQPSSCTNATSQGMVFGYLPVLPAPDNGTLTSASRQSFSCITATCQVTSMEVSWSIRENVDEPTYTGNMVGHRPLQTSQYETRKFCKELRNMARLGNISRCEELLRLGVPVEDPDGGGRVALHYAAEEGHLDIVKLLVQHKADVSKRSKYNQLAVDDVLHWYNKCPNSQSDWTQRALEVMRFLDSVQPPCRNSGGVLSLENRSSMSASSQPPPPPGSSPCRNRAGYATKIEAGEYPALFTYDGKERFESGADAAGAASMASEVPQSPPAARYWLHEQAPEALKLEMAALAQYGAQHNDDDIAVAAASMAPEVPQSPPAARDWLHEQAPEALKSMRRPLPKVAGGARWNLDKCRQGIRCEADACPCWHSECERVCMGFALGDCATCKDGDAGAVSGTQPGCVNGLHMQATELSETLCIDLFAASARRLPGELSKRPREANARHIRLIIYGIAAMYNRLLRNILAHLPLLHELVLPDRERDPHLLVMLSDLIELAGTTNPRLRYVVFSGDVCEAIW